MINNQTEYLALLGHPLGHSLSPMMHNSAFKHLGLNYIYLPFDIAPEHLSKVIAALPALGWKGANLTIPFKEKVLPWLDRLSPEAEIIGAVNVIKNDSGQLIGYNTDGLGFLASLAERAIEVPLSAVILGAGGAARAIATTLATHGTKTIYIFDINQEKAEILAANVSISQCLAFACTTSPSIFSKIAPQAQMVINCTPQGMYPHIDSTPVNSLDCLAAGTIICDIVYNPLSTKFLYLAEKRGLTTVNGLGMLIHQAALTWEIVLGLSAPVEFMKEVVGNELRQNRGYSD